MKQYRKTLLSLAFFAGLVSAVGANAADKKVSGLIAADNKRDYVNTKDESEIYTGISYKFSDTVTGGAETRQTIVWREQRKSVRKMGHDYLRFPFTISDLANVGDTLKLGIFARLTAPTDNVSQQAGQFGILSVGPFVKGTVGPIELLLRDRVSLFLNRQNAQRYSFNGSTAEANDRFAHVTEVEAAYPFTVDLKFTASWTHVSVRKCDLGNAKGSWAQYYDQDYELSYSPASFNGFSVGFATYNKTPYGAGVEFELWNKESTYNLRLAKAF
jgi:hypothetical protein